MADCGQKSVLNIKLQISNIQQKFSMSNTHLWREFSHSVDEFGPPSATKQLFHAVTQKPKTSSIHLGVSRQYTNITATQTHTHTCTIIAHHTITTIGWKSALLTGICFPVFWSTRKHLNSNCKCGLSSPFVPGKEQQPQQKYAICFNF